MNEFMNELSFPLLSLARLRMGTDGIGVTTLAAGAGCPLHCRYCINKRLLAEAPVEFISAEEMLERVRTDDLYFRATGGGITFGGGESLLHAAFIRRFREVCPREWRISAETSLAVPKEYLLLSVNAIDEYIVDCKDMNPDIYRSYTGGDAKLMKDNLEFLLTACGPERILVRVPLIPEFNTDRDRDASVDCLQKMGVHRLDLFEYVIR